MEVLRILLLEDSVADAELVQQELARADIAAAIQRVESEQAFARALQEFAPHVILSDHSLTQFDARAALELVRSIRPTTPLIVVTGALDEAALVACLKAGAEDCVLKWKLSRLGPAIEAALAVRRPLGKLSPRQIEVLRLLAEGHATREIARRLNLSVKTVETHRAEIMRRLGIRDLAGLVRYALRVGVVPTDA